MAGIGSSPDIATTQENPYYDMEQANRRRANLERALLDKGLVRKVQERVSGVKTYDGRDYITRERLIVPKEVSEALSQDPTLAAKSGIKEVIADIDNSGEPVIRVVSRSFGDTSTTVVEFTAGKDDSHRNHSIGVYNPDVRDSGAYFRWQDRKPADSNLHVRTEAWSKIDPATEKVLDRLKKFPDTFKPSLGQRVSGLFRR